MGIQAVVAAAAVAVGGAGLVELAEEGRWGVGG